MILGNQNILAENLANIISVTNWRYPHGADGAGDRPCHGAKYHDAEQNKDNCDRTRDVMRWAQVMSSLYPEESTVALSPK